MIIMIGLVNYSASPLPAVRVDPALAERLRGYLDSEESARDLVVRLRGRARTNRRLHDVVDVRERVPRIVILSPPAWSDTESRFKVRREVAERLHSAVDRLPEDTRLGFWEGYRPLDVQEALWDCAVARLASEAPHLGRPALHQIADDLVAHPGRSVPPHSTGSAVDIAALDPYGRVMNPRDPWGALYYRRVADALRGAGLANYTPEWWHWSYGDETWARANDCAPMAFACGADFDGPGGGI